MARANIGYKEAMTWHHRWGNTLLASMHGTSAVFAGSHSADFVDLAMNTHPEPMHGERLLNAARTLSPHLSDKDLCAGVPHFLRNMLGACGGGELGLSPQTRSMAPWCDKVPAVLHPLILPCVGEDISGAVTPKISEAIKPYILYVFALVLIIVGVIVVTR